MLNPKKRFSSRVENYIKYRPGYPVAILDFLRTECHLTSNSTVADVGSGTGILAKIFLENGNRVVGIEPNREMREAGERFLKNYSNFKSIDASAESTSLPDHTVDFVVAGQAFHWFDRERTRDEFRRILKPRGWIVLVWNERKTTASRFLKAYEKMLRAYGTDYKMVDHRQVNDGVIRSFFRSDEFHVRTFENSQTLDLKGLEGRLLSSSFVPLEGHDHHEAMMKELALIFQANQVEGKVILEYTTRAYFGQFPDAP